MSIDLTKDDIRKGVERYDTDPGTEIYRALECELRKTMQTAKTRKFMEPKDLERVSIWKSPRVAARKLWEKNCKDLEEISRASFAARSDRLRIAPLLALHGVDWPMASVILHFVFPDLYPILDKYTMKAIGWSTYYGFNKWENYVKLCQDNASPPEITMRKLDKALWIHGRDKLMRSKTGLADVR